MLRRTATAATRHVRLVHSSQTRFERLPTFTTPAPDLDPATASSPSSSPLPSSSSSKSQAGARAGQERLEPLPPTNLPVEDYASPLLHTASFFSTLFRYSVYGSVGIVTLALTSLVGVHLYVEHVALAPSRHQAEDDEEWIEQLDSGWSGHHLSNAYGTDPRLGLLARSAVRGAWISMNWASGTAASPLSQTLNPTQPHTAKFATVGPRMIGQDQARATRGQPVADSGWLMAEQYLMFALKKAQERGISLLEPRDWEKRIEEGGVDRAAVELEERLAGLRERIGGRIKLELAREGWERIYLALNQSPTTDTSTRRGKELAQWEEREKLLASRKLGELGQRIAELWGKSSEEGQFEAERAKHWFVRGLAPVLQHPRHLPTPSAGAIRQIEPPTPFVEESKKHVSASSSFFSFWSRSHPTTVTTPQVVTRESTDLSTLTTLLDSTSPEHFSPATNRMILSSLVSLETFLARTQSDLVSAQQVQTSALDFAKRLALSTAPVDSASTSAARPQVPGSLNEATRLLTSLYLTTRINALQTHLTECTLAQQKPKSNAFKRARDVGLRTLNEVRLETQRVVSSLPAATPIETKAGASTDTGSKKEMSFTKSLVSVDKRGRQLLEEQSRKIRRDAQKVEKIAQGLTDFLEHQQ